MAYKIIVGEAISQRLVQLQQEAVITLQAPALRAALKRLTGRLAINPYAEGEIIFHLTKGEPVHQAVEAPLAVTFAIFEQKQVVWIVRADRLAARHE